MPQDNGSHRRPGRPRDDRIDGVILQATLDELAMAGYQGMSMNSIAAKAGVSKPTIYRRWPNKTALAIAAIVDLVDHERKELSGDTIKDLAAQLTAAHENLRRASSVSLVGSILAEQEREPSFIETYRERLLTPRRSTLERILKLAQDRGEVRDDVELAAASLMLMGVLYASYIAGSPLTAASIESGVRTILEGLKA
jgi:AcrR family transcriptional regulator